MDRYIKETPLLNFSDDSVQRLIATRGWKTLSEKERILSIYNFVRDEIRFGYNDNDAAPASKVLEDGYGQCNTKGILFMALLRSVSIPCRLHGFMINKELQKGAITGIWYHLAPQQLLHSWVEVFYRDGWLNMEGFILDSAYLKKLQEMFKGCAGPFCGYGVSTDDFINPNIYWKENSTYIQKESISQDLGMYDDPDSFYAVHGQNLNSWKRFIYQNFTRHLMNWNIRKIRNR